MAEITGAHLTTDIVLFANHNDTLHVLLIRRGWDPFAGSWALPGGYVDTGETFAQAAERELVEETGLIAQGLVQVGVFDAPDRDPRGRVVSVAYSALLDHMPAPTAGDDARDARWIPVSEALAGPLAFDHAEVLLNARRVIERKRDTAVRIPSTVAVQLTAARDAYGQAVDDNLPQVGMPAEERVLALRAVASAERALSEAYGVAYEAVSYLPLLTAVRVASEHYRDRANDSDRLAATAEQQALADDHR